MTQHQWSAQPGPSWNRAQTPRGWDQRTPQGWDQRYLPPPRPAAGNSLKRVLVGLIGLALLAVIGFVVVSAVQPSSEVAYQNDDYQVPPPDLNPPPLPAPQTYQEAADLIQSSRIYGEQMPAPVRCTLTPIEVNTATDQQLADHFNELMACLVRAWEPPITQAGYEIVRPNVNIYGKSAQTKCGQSDVNAFYCGADQQVYFSDQLPGYLPVVRNSAWGADVVMAHEFGHAVQARTGILISSRALESQMSSKNDQLESSRRVETQADCFSGLFIRSVARSLGISNDDLPAIEATYVAVGDDTVSGKSNVVGDHGLAASREYWGVTGLGTADIGKCNTFAASPSLVR